MKKFTKIFTCAVIVLLVTVTAAALYQKEWIIALLLAALAFDWWIIRKDEKVIERLRRMSIEQCEELSEVYPKMGLLTSENEGLKEMLTDANKESHRLATEKDRLVKELAEADRQNALLRKDIKEAEKREIIFHKTIEDQRKENYSMSETIGALTAQLEALTSQNTTLKMKLSRKPHKKHQQQQPTL